MRRKKSTKRRVLTHLSNTGLAPITFALMVPLSLAVNSTKATNQVIGAKGGKTASKEALNTASG
jgi:hypothetical protein